MGRQGDDALLHCTCLGESYVHSDCSLRHGSAAGEGRHNGSNLPHCFTRLQRHSCAMCVDGSPQGRPACRWLHTYCPMSTRLQSNGWEENFMQWILCPFCRSARRCALQLVLVSLRCSSYSWSRRKNARSLQRPQVCQIYHISLHSPFLTLLCLSRTNELRLICSPIRLT